mmetsp:Transcript_11520/g.43014  ORF Transcript_11520/g.43014 Transcript_11520/m.43014 type:complete len:217 (-) Transcript_11520:161-811(-)
MQWHACTFTWSHGNWRRTRCRKDCRYRLLVYRRNALMVIAARNMVRMMPVPSPSAMSRSSGSSTLLSLPSSSAYVTWQRPWVAPPAASVKNKLCTLSLRHDAVVGGVAPSLGPIENQTSWEGRQKRTISSKNSPKSSSGEKLSSTLASKAKLNAGRLSNTMASARCASSMLQTSATSCAAPTRAYVLKRPERSATCTVSVTWTLRSRTTSCASSTE